MAKKIDVILTAMLNDGQTVKQPGETVSMEKAQAERLVRLGMVKLVKQQANGQRAEKPAKKAKNGDSKTLPLERSVPPLEGDDSDADDGDGDSGKEDEGS
jgi:hypothetical protein